MNRICLATWAAAALGVALSCADSRSERAGHGAMQRTLWTGAPALPVSVVLGAGSDEDQRKGCAETVLAHEGVYGAGAPITVDIDIREDVKVLRVFVQGAPAREETRPAWTVANLCRDALLLGLRVAVEQSGMPPSVVVALGSRASDDQRMKCQATLAQSGAAMAQGALTAVVEVDPSEDDDDRKNILQISSQVRGVVVQGARPGWNIGVLCQDALIQGLRAQLLGFAAPPAGPPPAQQGAPAYVPPPPPAQGQMPQRQM